MMNYRNTKTGEIVRTTGKVKGKNWVPIEDNPVVPPHEDSAEDSSAGKSAQKSSQKGKK